MEILYVKALHVVFVICWFAALFYIVRLFIYTTEAQNKEEPRKQILTEQLLIMQKKLWYIIGWPAMIGSLIFGGWLLIDNLVYFLAQPWMWLKLISVTLLIVYHLECQRVFKQQKNGVFSYTSFKLRLFNELATVLLVAIVFLVIVKSSSGLIWGVLGLFGFAAIIMMAVAINKRRRKD